MRAGVVALIVLLMGSSAVADEDSARAPRWSIGGGIGLPHVLHADVSYWLSRRFTLDMRAWLKPDLGGGGIGDSNDDAMGFHAGVTSRLGGKVHALILELGIDAGRNGDVGWEMAPFLGAGWGRLGTCWDLRLDAGAWFLLWRDDGAKVLPGVSLTLGRLAPAHGCTVTRPRAAS